MSENDTSEKRSSASSSGDENGQDFVVVQNEQNNRPGSTELLVDLNEFQPQSTDDVINQITNTILNAEKFVAEQETTSGVESKPSAAADVLSNLLGRQQEPLEPVKPVVEPIKPVVEPVKPAEPVKPQTPTTPSKPVVVEEKPAVTIKKQVSTCPVENMCNCFFEKLDSYPEVRDVLLWKCPKLSGGAFVASLAVLYCIATYSLVGLIGFFVLLTMTLVGSYRLYATILGYVKGTKDDAILKRLHDINLTIPKEKLNDIVNVIDNFGNKSLQKLKLLLLWDNLYASLAAFFVAYLVYSIGCTFNTITLLTFGIIDAFTLPKIYLMYKEPIDNVSMKVHVAVNDVLAKVQAKFPKLFPKKKTQ